MKALTIALCLVASISVFADPPTSPTRDTVGDPKGEWLIQSVMPDGSTQRFGEWKTREECEAAIKETEARNHSHGSQCMKRPTQPWPK